MMMVVVMYTIASRMVRDGHYVYWLKDSNGVSQDVGRGLWKIMAFFPAIGMAKRHPSLNCMRMRMWYVQQKSHTYIRA